MPEALVTVRGLTELSAALHQLGDAAKGEVLADGIRAGAEVLRVDVSDAAPRRTGRLARAIVTDYSSSAPGLATARIGPAREVFYGGIVNQGASPHTIVPRRASRRTGARRKVLASADRVFGRVVHHPGFAGRGYLAEAAERGTSAAVEAMARAMWFAIDRVVAGAPKG